MNRIPADTDPHSVFYLGQVVLCHVLSCEPDQMRLMLSLKVCLLIITNSGLAFYNCCKWWVVNPRETDSRKLDTLSGKVNNSHFSFPYCGVHEQHGWMLRNCQRIGTLLNPEVHCNFRIGKFRPIVKSPPFACTSPAWWRVRPIFISAPQIL